LCGSQIFDIPSRGEEAFELRYDFLQKTFGEGGSHAAEQIYVVQQEVAKSREDVLDKLKEVERLGGEGLMLRKPGSYVLLVFLSSLHGSNCLLANMKAIGLELYSKSRHSMMLRRSLLVLRPGRAETLVSRVH